MHGQKSLNPRIEINHVLLFVEAVCLAVVHHVLDRFAGFFHCRAHGITVNSRHALIIMAHRQQHQCVDPVRILRRRGLQEPAQVERIEVQQYVANKGVRLYLDLIDILGVRHVFHIPWLVARKLEAEIKRFASDKSPHPK